MDKQAIDPATALRFGVGGALMGGSTAAIVSMIHAINLARRQRKEQQVPNETDENTIVLTLPTGKTAEVKAENGMPVSVKLKDKPASSNAVVPAKSYRAGFYPNQEMKKADWQTLTASVLAATGGSMLGYQIINKAYQTSVQRRLKQQEEAARTEMIDSMMPRTGKVASTWLDDTFSTPAMKEAQLRERTDFSYLDAPFAMAALLTLLGSGGTAYVTKKILDNKLQEQAGEFKPPKVQRIVFKSAAALEPGEEQATAEDLDCIKSALCLVVDGLSGQDLRASVKVAQQLKSAGTNIDALYKLAQTDVSPIIQLLQQNPELRRSIQRIAMQQHPLLKHLTGTLDLPGISQLADRKLYAKVNTMGDQLLGNKSAGFVLPSFVGSVLADKAVNSGKEAILPKKKEMPADEEVEAEKLQEMLNNIQLSAQDPVAAAYVAEHQDKIRAALGRAMAATPKVATQVKAAQYWGLIGRKLLSLGSKIRAGGGTIGKLQSGASDLYTRYMKNLSGHTADQLTARRAGLGVKFGPKPKPGQLRMLGQVEQELVKARRARDLTRAGTGVGVGGALYGLTVGSDSTPEFFPGYSNYLNNP